MSARCETRGSARLAMTVAMALILAVGGTGFWFLNGGPKNNVALRDAPRYTVRRGDLPVTLKLKGTFAAEQAIKLRAKIRGSAKIVWLIDEGVEVKENDKLVQLDTTDVLKEIEQREIQLEKAEANLVAARADEVISDLDTQSKIRTAQMNHEMGKLEIDRFLKGTQPSELRAADLKTAQAQVQLERVTAIGQEMPKLFKQGFVTKEEVAQSDLDIETAKNALETAKLEKTLLVAYSHPMKIRKLEADKVQAAAELERFLKVAERRQAQTRATTKQRQQEYDRSKERLKDARERLENMTIRAPSDGIVVYGSGDRPRWWQPEEIKIGGTAYNNQALMRLPNLKTMQVVVKVHEDDINKVWVDAEDPAHRQEVTITTGSLPGKVFRGYVAKIDTLAQGEWGRQHVKRFETRITLEKQIPSMRPGMTADVEIMVDALKGVLKIPVHTVETRRGKSYCYLIEDGKVTPRPVTIGASNDSFVEIKKGLKEGEQLTTRPSGQSEENTAKKKPRTAAPYPRRRTRTR